MKLPKKRRRILELLFIEGLKPIEVSELRVFSSTCV